MTHPNGENSFWTEARIAELKERWAKWESFAEIAMALGHRSRNAVIGKAHRLGLHRDNGKPQPRTRELQPRRLTVRRNGRRHFDQGETMSQSEDPPPIFANAKRFIALEVSDCRWPGAGIVGPDLLCCAAPAIEGYPYCAAHCRLAYVTPGARPKAP